MRTREALLVVLVRTRPYISTQLRQHTVLTRRIISSTYHDVLATVGGGIGLTVGLRDAADDDETPPGRMRQLPVAAWNCTAAFPRGARLCARAHRVQRL